MGGGIPQSNVIFFYLFAAFFIFITLRGELRKYMGFLFLAPSTTTTSITVKPAGPSAATVAQTAVSFLG